MESVYLGMSMVIAALGGVCIIVNQDTLCRLLKNWRTKFIVKSNIPIEFDPDNLKKGQVDLRTFPTIDRRDPNFDVDPEFVQEEEVGCDLLGRVIR